MSRNCIRCLIKPRNPGELYCDKCGEKSSPRFYMAASYPRKEEAKVVAKTLIASGLFCTAGWLFRDEGYSDEESDDVRMLQSAERDLADIKLSHFLVELSGDTLSHGGRHCEVGIALGQHKPVFCLGRKEQIFHWLPEVKVCKDIAELLTEVLAWTSQPISW